MPFLSRFLTILVYALIVLIFGRVLVSWTDPSGRGRLSRMLIELTEPILGPVRRVLPRTGMIDLSPTIVLIVLFFLTRYL